MRVPRRPMTKIHSGHRHCTWEAQKEQWGAELSEGATLQTPDWTTQGELSDRNGLQVDHALPVPQHSHSREKFLRKVCEMRTTPNVLVDAMTLLLNNPRVILKPSTHGNSQSPNLFVQWKNTPFPSTTEAELQRSAPCLHSQNTWR